MFGWQKLAFNSKIKREDSFDVQLIDNKLN